MRRSIVLGVGSACAAAAATALFGTGVASADDYAGKTYSDASAAISAAGKTAIVATRVGDKVAQDSCVVTSSSSSTFLDSSGASKGDSVLLNLNCYATAASAATPGYSAGSAEGKADLAAKAEAAAGETTAPTG